MERNSANQSGRNAEDVITCVTGILKEKGYIVTTQHVFDIPTELSRTIIADILVRGLPNWEEGLVISVKRQESPGTAEEKIYYELRKINVFYPHPTLLLMIGDGWKSSLKRHIESQVGDRLIKVMFRYSDFQRWAESIPKANKQKTDQVQVYNLPLFDMESF